jgi:hypothetical protein
MRKRIAVNILSVVVSATYAIRTQNIALDTLT